MKYIRQIIFEMRHQPLMTWLSIVGTAIAIFLIMSDFMISNIHTVEVAPESNRSRVLYGYGGDLIVPNGSCSSGLSYQLANELYSNLDGVEMMSMSDSHSLTQNLSVKGKVPENRTVKSVDENYWKIYDYRFIEGKPFSKEEVESGEPVTILSLSTAENFFGKGIPYVGLKIMIGKVPHRITGIINDVNPLMSNTTCDAFVSHVAQGQRENTWNTYLGSYSVILLLKPGISQEYIRKQVENRYMVFNKKHKSEDISLMYHEQPWNTEELQYRPSTNQSPNLTNKHRTRLIAYAILILIPAINLSSMSRSRMRQRVSEIGLRRAFGCTRVKIIKDLLTENFIISLIGGLVGVILSIIFIICFSNYFISYAGVLVRSTSQIMARPTFEMLFSWRAFAMLLLVCFLLNTFSAGIPAFKAAFINPAEALSGHNPNK